MARRHRPPRCQAYLGDPRDERVCGHEMHPLAERDPAFGPTYRPGVWVFACGYCGALRAIDKTGADRYTAPV